MNKRSLIDNRRHPACWSRILLAFCGMLAAVSAETLYEQRFNDDTDIQFLKGAEAGPAGSGVSGKAADKAYTADTNSAPNAVAVISPTHNTMEADELTVTAWYKPRADIAGGTTLFCAFGTVLMWDGNSHGWIWRVETSIAEPGVNQSPYWFGTGKSPQSDWGISGDWTFIALVWKRDGSWVGFYQGDKNSPASLVRETTRAGEVLPLKIEGNTNFTIGNDKNKADRVFNGEIDNVRFFTKALDADAIEKIRGADLKNEEIKIP
ncbi:MAG: LamG-like jellyroll fold domain-containing protein [Verrucomicrobiota bacterium]